jgi:MFS family permease
MFKSNRNLMIIALIALVNMLGYGIIIPILFGYSKKYGLTDFQNGLLFALYSVCQFLATPVIGRLSDRYGRRPMLLISIAGTAASFFIMAFAPNALFLFLARALDGLTAGNIPVAFAVISDTTKPEDRAKAFGLIGSAFNFGFVFGPAIAALTVHYGQGIPFLIAGSITILAVILTAVYLPETNRHLGEVKTGKLIDLPLLWATLADRDLGGIFWITLVYFLAFSCAVIYGFQPFALEVLRISASQNALIFTLFGIVGLISQNFVVARISQSWGAKTAFSTSLIMISVSFMIIFFSRSLYIFIPAIMVMGVFNSIVQTLIPTILSQETDSKSQGSIMGLNTSYQSIGMISGPILGGIVTSVTLPSPFFVGSLLLLLCVYISRQTIRTGVSAKSAFNEFRK